MPPTASATVLVVEDEPEIQKFLKTTLIANLYTPIFAATAKDGIKLIKLSPPDTLILDLGLPDRDGLELIKEIREWTELPILVLSARGGEKDKVAALNYGADDYLTKPFGVGELIARLNVINRRMRNAIANHDEIFINGDLSIDLGKREVRVAKKIVDLTPTEYKMLCTLAKYVGRVVTYQQLLRDVWGKNAEANNHYLRIYTQHLRRKLGDDPMMPRYIVTEAGVGYRLKDLMGASS